ncbi:hypothetical protein SAMN06295879_3283 [Agreia bicolorata]|uniref:Uncharacterized protein n=2 Tax=Agreia bicolorata TaxID=110935 RepID=A0A1T4YIK3_9MICO|nr:hypothetical protein SAMN06295879_3283 [Agreia bicolorata]
MTYIIRNRGTIAKLAGGVLTASALLTSGIVASANWVGTEIQAASRHMSFDSSQGPVTWMDPDKQPAPEWTDVSKLTIVGTIDPATGNETDIPPTHPATIPQR